MQDKPLLFIKSLISTENSMADTNEKYPLEMTCQQVQQKQNNQEDFLLLDCREQEEYDTVKIEGSELYPMSQLQDQVEQLQSHKDQEIVVYCHHGGRSLRVAMWLRGQGFTKSCSMSGGIDQWAQEIDSSLPRY